eukprot:m.9808 g.9808  ORF g.9808 m.9808 type:complete len:444 (+) comp4137_c0_seq2:218-1549(+)
MYLPHQNMVFKKISLFGTHLLLLFCIGGEKNGFTTATYNQVRLKPLSKPDELKRVSHIAASSVYEAVYVADKESHCVRKYPALGLDEVEGRVVAGECDSPSIDAPRLSGPHAIAVDAVHEQLWVVDESKHLHSFSLTESHDNAQQVAEYDLNLLRNPASIAIASGAGHLFFSFTESSTTPADIRLLLLCKNDDLWGPCSACTLQRGMDQMPFLYYECERIQISIFANASKSMKSLLKSPVAMTVDTQTGYLYWVDSKSNRVFQFSYRGNFPSSITEQLDTMEVMRIINEGEIKIVAGTGELGKSDGAVLASTFYSPMAIAFEETTQSLLVVESRGTLRRIFPRNRVETLKISARTHFVAASVSRITDSDTSLFYCADNMQLIRANWYEVLEVKDPPGYAFLLISIFGIVFVLLLFASNVWRRKKHGPRYQKAIPSNYISESRF